MGNCYKWLVVLGSFGLHYISLGVVQSFGVLYRELLEDFKKGKSETGWIPSIGSGILLGFGPVSSVLERKFGCRVVATAGTIFISAGLASSMFVDDIHYLYLTYGVISGLGNGMVFQSAIVAVNQHFRKRCKLALTILATGVPFALLTTPVLTTYWIEQYGWRGTFLLMSGLCLNGVVFAALFRPVDKNKDESIPEETQNHSVLQDLRTIFKIKYFILFCVYTSLVTLGYLIPYVLIPSLAQSRGLSSYEAALIPTIAGCVGIIARLSSGVIAENRLISCHVMHGLALLVGAGFTVACAWITSVAMFLTYGAILGMFTGYFGALLTVITMEIVGKQHFSLAFGTASFFHGLTFIFGTPLAGWIADTTGEYGYSFFLAGALFFAGGVLSLAIRAHQKYALRSPQYKFQDNHSESVNETNNSLFTINIDLNTK